MNITKDNVINVIFFLFVLVVFSCGYAIGYNKADTSTTIISFDMEQVNWISSNFIEFHNGVLVQTPCGYYIQDSDPYFGFENYTLTPRRC